MIPVLTLWQPWASLIALGAKQIETRTWQTAYRGVVGIHASQYAGALGVCFQRDSIRRVLKANHLEPKALPLGKILALATLADVRAITAELRERTSSGEQEFGNFGDGRFAWYWARVRPLDQPLAATGQQGLWRWECPTTILDAYNRPAPPNSASTRP